MSSTDRELGTLQGVPQRPFQLPAGATEIILVRHGASSDAVPGTPFPLFEGQGDPPLSEAGERQAQSVARRLAKEHFSRLFVTSLQRTAQTAAPLIAATGMEATVVADLAEVRLGEWEGEEYRIRVANQDPIAKRLFEEERWDLIPGAESPEAFAERVRAGLQAVVEATGPDAVAVAVVHGGIIGEACRQATDSRPFAFIHADNGSLTRLVLRPDGRWLLRCFNDVSHLAVLTGPAG